VRHHAKKEVVFDYKVSEKMCCQKFYLFIHGYKSTSWLNTRISNYLQQDFVVVDRRGGCFNTLALETKLKLKTFITNYVEMRIMPSPADGVSLLPSTFAVRDMHKEYAEHCGNENKVSLTTVYEYLRLLYPYIRKLEPKTDYCSLCHTLHQAIKNAPNEHEKDESEATLQAHLNFAFEAREYYNLENVQASKLAQPQNFAVLSFDWAKNWEIPHYFNQPSDLYFLSRQKIGVFGITNESSNEQTFFCVPEAELNAFGKGPNMILSLLDYYLNTVLDKPKHLSLFADNCGAQNKNNYFLWYLQYQVYVLKKFEKITLNFLVQGHTKFSCDRHFGTAKNSLRRADNIETFEEVMTIIK